MILGRIMQRSYNVRIIKKLIRILFRKRMAATKKRRLKGRKTTLNYIDST